VVAVIGTAAIGCGASSRPSASPAPAGPAAEVAPREPAEAGAPAGAADAGVGGDAAAIADVREWVASPMEWGRAPASAAVVWRDVRNWPFFDEPVAVRLVAFEMDDGTRGIAVTGPITWCFLQIDFTAFTHEQLVKLYAGWFINFAVLNSPEAAAKQKHAATPADLESALTAQGFTAITILDRLQLGDDTYFAARATRDGAPSIVAGRPASITTYDPASPLMSLPPLYWYLGDTFYGE
jgi:hypothetical protein